MNHFVNEYNYTNEAIAEMVSRWWKWWLRVPMVLAAVFAVFGVLLLALDEVGDGVLVLAVAITMVVVLQIRARQAVKTEQTRGSVFKKDGPVNAHIEIGEDISMEVYGNPQKLDIANLERILESENYYVLCLKGRLLLPLKKDGFVEGTAEDCVQYLRQRSGCK